MFDDVPAELERVGAHRAPARRRSPWWAFGWAALATGVLVGAGVLAFSLTSGGTDFSAGLGSVASATPTAEPVTDPADIDNSRDITITILNGTETADLETTAETQLDDEGWPVTAATEAENRDTEATVVYYSDAANEDVARGVAIALGVGSVQLTDGELGAPVTVVLGTDYADAQPAN
jgi:hypothetical protein